MFISLNIVTLFVAILQPYFTSFKSEELYSYIISLEDHQFHKLTKINIKSGNQFSKKDSKNISKYTINKHINKTNIYEYTISNGDTLSGILTRYGINITTITMLIQQNPALCNLKIGQSLALRFSSIGRLQRLTWSISYKEIRIYNYINGFFKESILNVSNGWYNTIIIGQLNSNFVSSVHAIGIINSDINLVIKALRWQLDFRKLHKGDQFSILTSREISYNKITQGRLLGVHLRSSGKDYYVLRANNGKFYNYDASKFAKGFMRFPTIKQFRVSSHFNQHRLNPVTGRITPHLGVDFAVPIGTPVLVVGDGEVMISKHDNAAGNYVVIRHSHRYMTRYMHLKKLLVKPGQKVKRGDRIALSGNTGRSTGPHLHYEVWINEKAVNPLTAKLPRVEDFIDKNYIKYIAQMKQIQLQHN